jgi:hypothetical protein
LGDRSTKRSEQEKIGAADARDAAIEALDVVQR